MYSLGRREVLSLLAVLLLLPAFPSFSQVSATIKLWPEGAPLSKGTDASDQPILLPYVPEHPTTHTAVLVIPGGGYSHLSLQPEGIDIAEFLSAHGIPAFVLQYRIAPAYHYPVELLDGQRAVRYLRFHAKDYGFTHIGVAGFSAGGHLASMLGTSYDPGSGQASDPVDRVSDRPDFLVLGYPVISNIGWAASGSLHNLAGDLDIQGLEMLSTDLHVTPDTPPTFLVCADNDKSVSAENAVRFYLALHHAGVSAELHIYQHGGHGFGLAAKDPVDATWTEHVLDWMRGNGFLDASK